MDILKWQTIIIEWVNCLKLTKPIVIIEDLKDGEFFKELLVLLSKKEKTLSMDATTQISDFLKKNYPAFFLENESAQIKDSVEITYAYSLLLHYCSLVDCSEEFILPLCKDLCYMSQIFVKNFLEDLQLSSVITRDILKNAIYKMNKYASTPTKSIASSFGSPKTPNNTPLLDYLKTPYKKMNEEIHRREIKQIQAQLDLERFEKADLQEELNFQYEKNKKLDKNISEHQTEIRRLRAKVLSLENLTPPSNSKQDRNVENKRLRDEIVSLEKYVEILHKEQEELQTERDKARDKLRKMEENTTDWQNKYITNEKQILKLTEENKNYLQELFYLRERCEELSTMLHELNPKRSYDESYEADLLLYDSPHNKSGSVVDSASLAQTVVDVQLVDAQTENRKLKTQLGEFEQTTEKLTSQLNIMESEMIKLQSINRQFEETQFELDNVKIELQKTCKVLSMKTEENENLNAALCELNQKTSELESSLNFTQKENANLIDELKLTTEMNKAFIDELNNDIKSLITEKERVNEKLSEMTQKAENCESSNEMLQKKFNRLNADMETSLIKFKSDLNYDEEFPHDSDVVRKLSILINVFAIKNNNNTTMIYNLQDSYQLLLTQITKLEDEVTTLNLNEVERKREIDRLKICLKTAENKIEHYEKEVVTNYENLIEKYKSIIEEKCGMISELTKLKDVLINKENMIMKLQSEQQELQNELIAEKTLKNNLEKSCSNFKNIINEKENFIKSLELEKSNLQENFDVLNERLLTELNNLKDLKALMEDKEIKLQTLEIEKNNLQEKIVNLEEEATQLNTDKMDLNTKCEYLNNEITGKNSHIEEVNTQNQNNAKQIETLEEEITTLENTIKTFKSNCETLQQNVEDKTCSINNLQLELEEVSNKLSDTESTKSKFETLYNQTKQTLNDKINYINDLNNQKHELENQIDGLTNQLKSLEEDLSHEKTLKDVLNNDLKHVKEELIKEKSMKDDLNNQFIASKQNHEVETEKLCDQIEAKCLEIVSLQEEIGTLNENIKSVNDQVLNITSLLYAENSNIETKEKTVKNLSAHLINLKNQLSLTLEEKKETMEEVKLCKQKIQFHKEEFETYKHELENVFEEINMHLVQQIKLKEQDYCDFGGINEEIPILETLKEVLHAEQQKDKEILGDMLHKIIKLKHNIYNLVFENHRVTSEMNTLQKQYNILDNLKIDIEQKLAGVTAESNIKIADLHDQLETLETENQKYISNLEVYRENLSKAHETFAETQISVDGLIKKHKMETDNYKESIAELRKKNSRLEEQMHQLKVSEKSLKDELFGQQNKLQHLLEDYDTTVKQKEDIKHKKETLSNKLMKQTETFEQLQGSLSKTNLELEASLREIDMYKTLKTDFEKSFAALNKDHEVVVNNYETRIKKIKQENDELKDQAEELIKEVVKIKDKLGIEKTKQIDLDLRMKNFSVETEKLEENVLHLTDKLESTEEERRSLGLLNDELKCMLQETKINHEREMEKLQRDINKLHIELESNEKQIEMYEMKKVEFKKLRENNKHLQNKIDDLNDDKNVLTEKVEQLNEDLVKLKSCCDERYKEKLDEINDTKTKLSYTLSLIENIYKLLESELDKSSVELKQSDETITEKDENLCNKIENEITNLKTRIEELLNKKNELQIDVENITIKVSEIEETRNQDKLDYEQKYEELITENKEKLNTLQKQNNEIIESLEKRLKQEEKTSQIYLNEVETLNTKLIEKLDEIDRISNEKRNLIKEYKIIASKLSLLKQNRDDLAEDHQKIIKEVETYIIRTHESVDNIKKDFTNRMEQHEKHRETDQLLIKQLEDFLQVEKNNVSFLENRVKDLTTEKNQLITITSKSFTNIHELYNQIFDDSDVTEQINKLKQNQSEIEDELQSINFEQEIVDKEIELINNELIDLKKIRGEMTNYELVKSDYVTLKNKYNLMSVCETENNGYKLKISDLESKLTDLQKENAKYQKEITEVQKELTNLKDEHKKELNLMETSYANWKKIAEDKNDEIEVLIEKYATEIKEISDLNIELHKTVKELEDKLYLNEELIYQEKCKNEDLTSANNKLEKELEKQTQTNEKLITDGKTDYDVMNQKYELLSRKIPNLEDEILTLQEKLARYKNFVAELEKDNLSLNKNHAELKHKFKVLMEHQADMVDKEEVMKLRASHANVMGENSRLQLDCAVMKKTIDERNTQLSELSFIKESYEKLLEDNNKALMELDTLRYKRNRDKEEFKRLLEEERAKGTTNADSQITDIRNEYEEKLKKMKEKMVNLYKEEMEREKKRITLKLSQSEEIVQSLKSQLWVTGNKNVDLTKEVERLREQLRLMKEKYHVEDDFRGSRESMSSLKERRAVCDVEERRISTLPRDSRSFQRPQVNIIEETVTVSRKRRSITGGGLSNLDQGLKMEDEEGELFNNTYLSDLKAGKCIESVSSRLSELQYRNSLCPPHLKSSYPAETQFQSPGQFKEEDLKMGTVDLDDSMSSSLLPGEKPRMKKDWGQTMYKKPGPPTPSKNGGRLSLQGNEVHPRDVLREQNENKQAGRATSTPSRIKMLFTRSGASHRNDSEVGTKARCLHHSYEHSLVPLLTRPEPVRLNPQLIKVYHIPHTFGQAFRYYCNNDLIRAILLMFASAFTTYLSFVYIFDM